MIKYVLVAAASFGAGYWIAGARLRPYYVERIARESDDAKDYYKKLYDRRMAADAAEAMAAYSARVSVGPSVLEQELAEAEARTKEAFREATHQPPKQKLQSYADQYQEDFGAESESMEDDTDPEPMETAEGPLVVEHFAGPVNYNRISTPEKIPESKTEVKDSEKPAPFEITAEDFVANPKRHEQISMTFYAGDGILANESDEPVESSAQEIMLGWAMLENLKSRTSGDFYVQNDESGWLFAIARSPGKFSVEVSNETE